MTVKYVAGLALAASMTYISGPGIVSYTRGGGGGVGGELGGGWEVAWNQLS